MRYPRFPLALLTAAAGLAACDAPITSPEARPGGVSPSTSAAPPTAAAPELLAVRGATVERGQGVEFLLHLDRDRGLMSVHAPADFCTTFQVGVFEAQAVTTPSQIEQFVFQAKGEGLPVVIYEADSFADAGLTGGFDTANINDVAANFPAFCAFLAGPDRIAEGTVRRVSNLSNASFAASWTGTLERVGGGDVRLTELYQLTADAQEPSDPSLWSVNASKVLLH